MADSTQKGSQSVLGDVESALKGVKGSGDAIRGTFNESIDTAFHEPEGGVKNKAIADKGVAEMEATEQHFDQSHDVQQGSTATGRGAATAGTQPATASGTTGSGMATGTGAGSTTRQGAHSGPVGNMESTMPTADLGGEPEARTDRY